ncbi:MAG: hypothetical protein GTO12_20340 [Proteobacteria bacterium]|nr:hypothetical protein [Pseudomonadota bacterium]
MYRYIRHPQYAGLFLIVFGWLLHWTALFTPMMFPTLITVYYMLAVREEKTLEEAFGTK